MTTKLVDSKGRLMLGNRLAGRMVIIDDSDPDHIVITPAVAIPEREVWLYKNPVALERVRKGLDAARKREFVDATESLKAGAKLADQIED